MRINPVVGMVIFFQQDNRWRKQTVTEVGKDSADAVKIDNGYAMSLSVWHGLVESKTIFVVQTPENSFKQALMNAALRDLSTIAQVAGVTLDDPPHDVEVICQLIRLGIDAKMKRDSQP